MKIVKALLFVALLAITMFCKAQNNIRMTSYYDINDKKAYYIVWDIKTGKSMQYYWDGTNSKWASFEINLPEKPITGALGNIMMDVFYDHNDTKAYYLVWDTKTGKSVQYYWDATNSKWASFEINLPEKPLPGATGDIMMKTYFDSNDFKAYYIVWDANGGKSIQYYWNGTDSKWVAFEINLPEKPLN